MTKDEVLAHFKTAAATARALGLTQQAVQQWRTVPLNWQIVLEQMTAGDLKADLPSGPKMAATPVSNA
jgi:hypothetical protein